MKAKAALGARILLGLIFFVFGINGFLQFYQPPMNEAAMTFIGSLISAGYLMPLVKFIEVIAGALLLSNFFVPLALLLLAPIIVNIVAIHLFIDIGGLPVAAAILLLELFLVKIYWSYFKGVLIKKASPNI